MLTSTCVVSFSYLMSLWDSFFHDDPHADGTPIIQKGLEFIYNYQAVTSQSESKVRVSSFP